MTILLPFVLVAVSRTIKNSLNVQLNAMRWAYFNLPTVITQPQAPIDSTMPVLMSCYQVLMLHFVIMACVLAYGVSHALSVLCVEGDECILLMLNQKEITVR